MSLVGFWVAWGTITGFGGFGPPRPTPPIASPRLAVVAVCRRGWRRSVFLCFPLPARPGVAPSPSSSRRVVPRCCPSACVGSRNSPRDAPQLIVSPGVSLGVPVSSSALARDRRELGARPTKYFLFCFSLGRPPQKIDYVSNGSRVSWHPRRWCRPFACDCHYSDFEGNAFDNHLNLRFCFL